MTGWLVDTLLATSLLMVLVLLIREPVRRQFGPAVAYGLWLIPAVRVLMPTLTTTVERTVPAPESLSHSVVSSSPAPSPEVSLLDQLGGWEGIALAVWIAGAAAMLTRGFLVYHRQRRAVLADSVQLAQLDGIRIVRSAAVGGPMAFGIVDRVIVLPIDFDERYHAGERRLALDHELAHHRSGDLVANHFAFVLLCLQWFNPLAWASHTAFRFDQEAACDARVLDKANAHDRAAYAQTIARAASGRALLFAGALDRPGTLQRRLRSMLTNPGSGRRTAGKVLIALTATAALPLTASWAVKHVDVPSAAPAAPARPAEQLQPVAAVAPVPATPTSAALALAAAPVAEPREVGDGNVVLPGGVTIGKGSVAFFADDRIIINGRIKRVEELTRAERAELRAVIVKSRHELERERARLPARLAEAQREVERIRSGAHKRELMDNLEDLRRDLAEIDLEAAELRASGQDPEKLKAEIIESLREAQAVDIDKEVREALAELNPDKIVAEIRTEEAQMVRLRARLDQLDRAGN